MKLLRDSISHDTVQCLTELLSLAKDGEVTGLAFAATLKGRSYIVNTAGYAHKNPTFARGIVCAIDDELRDRIQRQATGDTVY